MERKTPIRRLTLDVSGSWDGHMNAVHPEICTLDRRGVEAMAAAPCIAVTNSTGSRTKHSKRFHTPARRRRNAKVSNT